MTPNNTGLLIAEIEKRSLLWSTNSPFYKDKAKRTEAWKEIAKIVYPDCKGKIAEVKKVKELQSRWKSIRDSYTKHMKRFLKVGPNGPQNKPYVFASNLTFLDKFLTFRDAELEKAEIRNKGKSYFQHQQGGTLREESDTKENAEEEESDVQEMREEQGSDAHNIQRKLRVNLVSFKPDPESVRDLDGAPDTSSSHGQSAAEEPKYDLWILEEMVRRVVKETTVEQDPDMAFFTMLLPTLRNFTEDQKLEFRTEVLLIMRAIKAGTNKTTLVSASSSSH